MGDFLGFTFGGIHSSDLGITRVSGGDRYNEELFPEMRDRTAEVPGVNGEYYFGSDFEKKSFKLDIAYDSLTDYQFRRLRRIFGTTEIRELIFDEAPYKRYLTKIDSPIELSFVCFDEPTYTWEKEQIGFDDETGQPIYQKGIGDQDFEHKVYSETTQRIYKGEGTISFTCYFPFAKSVYKVLPSAEEESDWVLSSGILNSTEYASVDKYNNGSITVYNPGDVATGFRLYLPATALNSETSLIYKEDRTHTTATLQLKTMTLKTGDVGVLVDTNNGLITGVSSPPSLDPVSGEYIYTTSGNLYNEYVSSGYFFHLEPNVFHDYSTLQITGGASGIRIFYDYLYF